MARVESILDLHTHFYNIPAGQDGWNPGNFIRNHVDTEDFVVSSGVNSGNAGPDLSVARMDGA